MNRRIIPVLIYILSGGLYLGMLNSCKDLQFPVNLIIEGVPPGSINKFTTSVEEKNNRVIFTSHDPENTIITVHPWFKTKRFSESVYTIETRQYEEPVGPERTLIVYQDNSIIAFLFDNISRLPAPINHYMLSPGNKIDTHKANTRDWVEVVLQYGGQSSVLKPGTPYSLIYEESEWILIIFGATVSVGKIVTSTGNNTFSLAGKEPEPEREEAPFLFDCILFKHF